MVLGHLVFSYVGAVYLIMLFIPYIIWIRHKPVGYTSDGENRVLSVFERVGETVVTCKALIFSDFNIDFESVRILWLFYRLRL